MQQEYVTASKKTVGIDGIVALSRCILSRNIKIILVSKIKYRSERDMSVSRKLLGLVALTLLTLSVMGCIGGSETVKIGMLSPQTGPIAQYAPGFEDAAKIAISDLNAFSVTSSNGVPAVAPVLSRPTLSLNLCVTSPNFLPAAD